MFDFLYLPKWLSLIDTKPSLENLKAKQES